MAEPVAWGQDGSARSPRFNDIYRSRYGGLGQAQGVFLAGCGLPDAWRGRNVFTVLETGFGLGLNFLATWAAWDLAEPSARCASLHFISVEAYPVAPQDLLRGAQGLRAPAGSAADPLARVQRLATSLASAWPPDLPAGPHEMLFASGQVRLTELVGPVREALDAQPACRADAAYLDGFSPALNPEMWSADTLAAVARHCKPGARIASYTVAAPVRQALRQLGFSVQKSPGVPPKRHRMQGVFQPDGASIR
jgi:tRNA 5-methylaminomethyl-2-thiouridine biosynthesis bifunctional protein